MSQNSGIQVAGNMLIYPTLEKILCSVPRNVAKSSGNPRLSIQDDCHLQTVTQYPHHATSTDHVPDLKGNISGPTIYPLYIVFIAIILPESRR